METHSVKENDSTGKVSINPDVFIQQVHTLKQENTLCLSFFLKTITTIPKVTSVSTFLFDFIYSYLYMCNINISVCHLTHCAELA